MLLCHVDVRNTTFLCSSNIAHLSQQRHKSKFVILQEKPLKVLKCYNFLWVTKTTQLLSSSEFCKLLYDIIPVKNASANVSFHTNNLKIPNFELWHSCRKWAISRFAKLQYFHVTTVRATFFQKGKDMGCDTSAYYLVPFPLLPHPVLPLPRKNPLPSVVAIHIANVTLSYHCSVLVVLGIMKICQARE